jgi:Icc-related predicted phosphoesterase
VHGSEKTYIKFLNAACFYKSQYLILGGDITGKMIVPLIKGPDGYQADFRGIPRQAKDETQAQALELEIRQLGGYPYRTDGS